MNTIQPQFDERFQVAWKTLVSPVQGGRAENQDNLLVVDPEGSAIYLKDQSEARCRVENWTTGCSRLAILDGVGGHAHGREAAERIAEGLLTIPACCDVSQFHQQLNQLHHDLRLELHRKGEEPAATLTLLEISSKGSARLFHVGDSRLYRVSPEQEECLTVDHVPATRFAMLGHMGEEEWRQQVHGESRCMISQAFVLGNSLGGSSMFAQNLEPDLLELNDRNLPDFLQGLGDRRPIELVPGSAYLLATDGLWDLRNPEAFVQQWPKLLHDPSLTAQARLDRLFNLLVETNHLQNLNGGDNATAILLVVKTEEV